MRVVNIFTGEVTDAMFATPYLRPVEDAAEKMDQRSQTETSYIPPEIQIMDMMQAGKRLADERRARFAEASSPPEEGEPEVEVFRQPGVDLVDVTRAADQAIGRIRKSEKEAQAKAKEAAAAADQARIDQAVKAALAAKEPPK